MKKIVIAFLLVIQFINAKERDSLQQADMFKKYYLSIEKSITCDGCGCSASGGSMGYSSMLNSNFVGIRYIYQSYTAKEGIFNNSPWADENFNTIQIWSRIPVTKRIQITALVPFHFNNRELTSGSENISGLGDITLIGMYTVIETKKDSAKYSHKVQFGGGIKAPTGKYDVSNQGTLNPSFQLGTGSWDYILTTEYVIKRKKIGLNTALSYMLKTENQKQYQFGNQFNYGSTLFYLFNWNNFRLAPQLGIAGEVSESNRQVQQRVIGTSGDVLFSKFGLEIEKGKFSFGINSMAPINQNLTNGNVRANYRLSLNLNYEL